MFPQGTSLSRWLSIISVRQVRENSTRLFILCLMSVGGHCSVQPERLKTGARSLLKATLFPILVQWKRLFLYRACSPVD